MLEKEEKNTTIFLKDEYKEVEMQDENVKGRRWLLPIEGKRGKTTGDIRK